MRRASFASHYTNQPLSHLTNIFIHGIDDDGLENLRRQVNFFVKHIVMNVKEQKDTKNKAKFVTYEKETWGNEDVESVISKSKFSCRKAISKTRYRDNKIVCC